MPEAKPSNPKDAIGVDKCPLHLIPTTVKPEVALALLEGALKYGQANWREVGVRASIYRSAVERHLDKWWEGEDRDPETLVHHIGSAIASLSIILDANLAGKLLDDRPIPCGAEGRARQALDDSAERVRHLRKLFSECSPHHHTRNNLPKDEEENPEPKQSER